jgi:hypothetical protein
MDHHLRITLAMPEHTDALLAFELDNRPHFEQWIASRGDAFYTAAAVRSSLEQRNGQEMRKRNITIWPGSTMPSSAA